MMASNDFNLVISDLRSQNSECKPWVKEVFVEIAQQVINDYIRMHSIEENTQLMKRKLRETDDVMDS